MIYLKARFIGKLYIIIVEPEFIRKFGASYCYNSADDDRVHLVELLYDVANILHRSYVAAHDEDGGVYRLAQSRRIADARADIDDHHREHVEKWHRATVKALTIQQDGAVRRLSPGRQH